LGREGVGGFERVDDDQAVLVGGVGGRVPEQFGVQGSQVRRVNPGVTGEGFFRKVSRSLSRRYSMPSERRVASNSSAFFFR
jgi:hypothetical protein